MPEISKITLPSGTTYDIKDATARAQIGGAIVIRGTTTTPLTDEATTNPITIDGNSYTAVNNDAVFYQKQEFVFDGAKWHEFGDMSGLGDLALKDSASGSYTPAGSVSAPVITVSSAGSTTSINNPTSKTVVTDMSVSNPSSTNVTGELVYCSVSNETLTLKKFVETTGDSISTSAVTVKNGDAAYSASAPSFTGTAATITVS